VPSPKGKRLTRRPSDNAVNYAPELPEFKRDDVILTDIPVFDVFDPSCLVSNHGRMSVSVRVDNKAVVEARTSRTKGEASCACE
jgi:hypothetical protein